MTGAPSRGISRFRDISAEDLEKLRRSVQARLVEKRAERERQNENSAHRPEVCYDEDYFEILRLLEEG